MYPSYNLNDLLNILASVVSTVLSLWLLWKLLGWLFGGPQPSPWDAIKRWQGVVPALDEKPENFYARFDAKVKTKLNRPDLPLHKLRFGPRKLRSTRLFPGSWFSVRPLYLKVSFKHFSYYVFAVNAPGGLFLSSWAFSTRTQMAKNPSLVLKLRDILRKETLFEYDVAALFAHFMHETLIEVVDEYTAERKLPPLSAPERRPIMGQDYAMPADIPATVLLGDTQPVPRVSSHQSPPQSSPPQAPAPKAPSPPSVSPHPPSSAPKTGSSTGSTTYRGAGVTATQP